MSLDHKTRSLHGAVMERSLTAIVELLNQGAFVNEVKREGTPLIVAVRLGFIDGVKLLLERGAGVNIRVRTTPLHIAAELGNVEIFQILVDNGANFEAMNDKGQTPLFLSVQMGAINIFELLLSLGANINAKDVNRNTPLHFAAEKFEGFIRPLIDRGVNLEAKNFKGETAIHKAAENSISQSEILIQSGACVNVKDKNGYTPLHKAVFTENIPIIKLLLKSGAEINAKDSEGWTALLHASEDEYPDVFRLLLDYGACLNIKERFGKLPADLNPHVEDWLDELERLKAIKFGAWSLYDIFHISGYSDPVMLGNAEVIALLQSSSLKSDFPFYAPYLTHYCIEAKSRYDLLIKAQQLRVFPLLPEEINRLILLHLCNKDLLNFIAAFKSAW